MKIKIISFLLLSLFFYSVRSQENLSLSDALKKGLENNYSIQITNLNVDISKNNNSWGMAGLYPKLGITGSLANSSNDTKQKIQITTPSSVIESDSSFTTNALNISPGINLNWVIFNGFAVRITKAKLEYYQQLSEGNLALLVENTIQAIYLAYFNVLLEQEKQKVVNELMALSRDRYNYILDRKNLGSAVTYEVLQAKNAFLADSANILLQQLNVKNSQRNLNLLLGVGREVEFLLTDELMILDAVYEYGEMYTRMEENNKTLINQYINHEIVKKEVNLAKSALYPVLSFNGSGSLPYNQFIANNDYKMTSNTFNYSANFSLSMNLFNGQRTQKTIQNAKIQEQIGGLQIDEMKLNLSIILANILDFYNIRKQLYHISLESLETAKLNLAISNEKFKSGSINSFNYRDVQLTYMNVAFNKLQTMYNVIETHSELMRITGNMVTEF